MPLPAGETPNPPLNPAGGRDAHTPVRSVPAGAPKQTREDACAPRKCASRVDDGVVEPADHPAEDHEQDEEGEAALASLGAHPPMWQGCSGDVGIVGAPVDQGGARAGPRIGAGGAGDEFFPAQPARARGRSSERLR